MTTAALLASLSAATLLIASPATACVLPLPSSRLSGESEQAYRARNEAFLRAVMDEERRQYQVSLFDKADLVILARVEARDTFPIDQITGYAVEASTVAVLKGDNAPPQVRLANEYMTTCGMAGGGSATQAEVGEYIVALHGRFFPSGEIVWHGFKLIDLRDLRLFKGVDRAAREMSSSQSNKASK